MTRLSRGARLCEVIIRRSRALKGGARMCGRSYLAARLGCTVRTVSRYLKELREAGRILVTPPRRVRRLGGWRTEGTNTYRLPLPANPAPHIRRSRRGDTPVTPSPTGIGGSGRTPPDHARIDPGPAAHALIARLLAVSGG